MRLSGFPHQVRCVSLSPTRHKWVGERQNVLRVQPSPLAVSLIPDQEKRKTHLCICVTFHFPDNTLFSSFFVYQYNLQKSVYRIIPFLNRSKRSSSGWHRARAWRTRQYSASVYDGCKYSASGRAIRSPGGTGATGVQLDATWSGCNASASQLCKTTLDGLMDRGDRGEAGERGRGVTIFSSWPG